MDKFLYIKYGELSLKGKNKKDFINLMFSNIKKALSLFENIKIIKEYDNLKIFYNDNEYSEIINILKFVPGIQWILPAIILDRNIEKLKELTLLMSYNFSTYKIECKRKDKNYNYRSDEIINIISGNILKNNKNISVDVHNPNTVIKIEVLNDKFIYYTEKIKGAGGFPTGSNKKVLMLLSGGIDSPVASYLLQKKGCRVDFVTFITPPYTSEKSLEKTKDLIKKITLNGKIQNSNLYVINFTKILHELNHIENKSYKITLMRRSFFRISKMIAKKINAFSIATGESIGQVASQTIESMDVISSAIDDMMVFRPLLTMDKIEIINIAKEIGTYDISIRPYDDSCSIFAPKNPITKPKIEAAEKYEDNLIFLTDLENKIIDSLFEGEKNVLK